MKQRAQFDVTCDQPVDRWCRMKHTFDTRKEAQAWLDRHRDDHLFVKGAKVRFRRSHPVPIYLWHDSGVITNVYLDQRRTVVNVTSRHKECGECGTKRRWVESHVSLDWIERVNGRPEVAS